MKRIVVIADTKWSVHRVHTGIEKSLGEGYSFIYHECSHFYLHKFLEDLDNADVCITTLNLYGDMMDRIKDDKNRKKVIILCHGTPEYWGIPADPSSLFTYAATSAVLVPYLSSRIQWPIHIMPNGVEPRNFVYRQRAGCVKSLGWCGDPTVASKRFDWAVDIATGVHLPLSVARTMTPDEIRDWYGTIDVLLMTAGPDPSAESGPLPPFEAIVSGVVVIGTAVGNFASVPGPKFTTREEAVAILEELKADPAKMQEIHKQQYECVMANWTYDTIAPKWVSVFDAVIAKRQDSSS